MASAQLDPRGSPRASPATAPHGFPPSCIPGLPRCSSNGQSQKASASAPAGTVAPSHLRNTAQSHGYSSFHASRPSQPGLGAPSSAPLSLPAMAGHAGHNDVVAHTILTAQSLTAHDGGMAAAGMAPGAMSMWMGMGPFNHLANHLQGAGRPSEHGSLPRSHHCSATHDNGNGNGTYGGHLHNLSSSGMAGFDHGHGLGGAPAERQASAHSQEKRSSGSKRKERSSKEHHSSHPGKERSSKERSSERGSTELGARGVSMERSVPSGGGIASELDSVRPSKQSKSSSHANPVSGDKGGGSSSAGALDSSGTGSGSEARGYSSNNGHSSDSSQPEGAERSDASSSGRGGTSRSIASTGTEGTQASLPGAADASATAQKAHDGATPPIAEVGRAAISG